MGTEVAAATAEEGGGGGVERLPEDCLSRILSFTSPCDVCRSSAVSSAFLTATASDLVWDRFLPPDHEGLLARSSSPVIASSRRELYFRLCGSIPIDDGSKIVWLEKATGKKCYLLSARALGITWGNDPRYWRWISVPDHARFPEVAELLDVCWLDIRASICSGDLSPGTRYGAYLVMHLSDSPYGLQEPPQETVISVGGVPSSTHTVRLQERRPQHICHQQEALFNNNLLQFAVNEGDIELEEEDQVQEDEEEDLRLPEGADDAGGEEEEEEEDLPLPEGADDDVGEEEDDDMIIWVHQVRGDGRMELDVGEVGADEELVEMRLNGTQSMISLLPEEEEEGEISLLPEEAGEVREAEEEEGEGVLQLPDLEEAPTMDGGSSDEALSRRSDDDSGISETSLPDHDQQVGQPPDMIIWVPRGRGDGWMELDMGEFFVEAGAGEELVEMRLNGTQSMHWKSGLVVHGIELRPLP